MGSDRVVPRTARRTLRARHDAIHDPRTRDLSISESSVRHHSAASLAATHASTPNPTNATMLLAMPCLRSDIASLAHAAIARARAALAACHSTHDPVDAGARVSALAELHFIVTVCVPPLRTEPTRAESALDVDALA